ncbi:hypothetical protein ASD80_13795 [Devosia sp. Root635]|nr:hypothetical protein ASD80_13795 [Devosia sp. Root635]
MLLSGGHAEAAVAAPELRITISAAPQAGVAAVPTTSAVAVAVPAASAVAGTENTARPVEAARAEPVAPLAAPVAPATAQSVAAPVAAASGQQAVLAAEIAAPVASAPAPGNAASVLAPLAAVSVATPFTPAAPIAASAVSLPVTPVGVAAPDIVATTGPAVAVAVPTAPAVTAMTAGTVPTIAASIAPAGAPAPASAPSVASSGTGIAPTVAPTAAAPVAPAQLVAATDSVAEPVTVVASLPDDVVVLPPEPDGIPTANALDRFVAGYDGGTCFAASVVRGETPMLAAFARDMVDSVALQLALGEAFTETVDIDGYRVDSRQCGALAFVSRLQQAAATPMALALASQSMADGAHVTGTLAAPPGQRVYLFVVDDEGLVSDSGAYLAGQGPGTTFSVPVHLTGDSQARIQLLIAVSTDAVLESAPGTASVDAGTFFADLAPRLAGRPASVAIDAFIVR